MKILDPLEVFDDVILKISTSVSRDFPGVDREDISQHLYLKILENRSEFKSPDGAGVTGALWRMAKMFAGDQRAEALHVSPQYSYSAKDIKRILEHTFDRNEWYDTYVPEDAKSIKDSADELDLQSDISWAWTQLPQEDQKVIFEKYALHDDLTEAKRKRCDRAIDKLVEIVNTYPRPGHPRTAISNTRAQHMIGSGYE